MREALCRAAAAATWMQVHEECLLNGVALPTESATIQQHVENTWRDHQAVVMAVLGRLETIDPAVKEAVWVQVGDEGVSFDEAFAAMLREASK